MPTLHVTVAELQYLVDQMGSLWHWPARSAELGVDALMFIPPEKRVDPGGGPGFRLRLLALYRYSQRNDHRWPTLPLELSLQEAWLIDQTLWTVQGDLTRVAFKDGQPLISLAVRVWDLLIQEHADQLPEHLRIELEAPNAGDNPATRQDPDRDALKEADAAIAAVEAAIHRSRQDKGAAEDMPTAAA